MKRIFTRHGYKIINQDPTVLRVPTQQAYHYLDMLLTIVSRIERETGFRWMVTSWIRESTSHPWSTSIDIAPDIHPGSQSRYAVNNGSDPVLYKRVPLVRALQRVAKTTPLNGITVGIFIEPDHLHIQLFQPEPYPTISVYKWKQPKASYRDTTQRMDLPLTSSGYKSSFNV
jgi:hypothetical protein